ISYLCQARQNLVLDSIRKVGVLFVAAQVFERHHRNALFGNSGRCWWGRAADRPFGCDRWLHGTALAAYLRRAPRKQVPTAGKSCDEDNRGDSDHPATTST